MWLKFQQFYWFVLKVEISIKNPNTTYALHMTSTILLFISKCINKFVFILRNLKGSSTSKTYRCFEHLYLYYRVVEKNILVLNNGYVYFFFLIYNWFYSFLLVILCPAYLKKSLVMASISKSLVPGNFLWTISEKIWNHIIINKSPVNRQ